VFICCLIVDDCGEVKLCSSADMDSRRSSVDLESALLIWRVFECNDRNATKGLILDCRYIELRAVVQRFTKIAGDSAAKVAQILHVVKQPETIPRTTVP
jgi:hypothetical protein